MSIINMSAPKNRALRLKEAIQLEVRAGQNNLYFASIEKIPAGKNVRQLVRKMFPNLKGAKLVFKGELETMGSF